MSLFQQDGYDALSMKLYVRTVGTNASSTSLQIRGAARIASENPVLNHAE